MPLEKNAKTGIHANEISLRSLWTMSITENFMHLRNICTKINSAFNSISQKFLAVFSYIRRKLLQQLCFQVIT